MNDVGFRVEGFGLRLLAHSPTSVGVGDLWFMVYGAWFMVEGFELCLRTHVPTLSHKGY